MAITRFDAINDALEMNSHLGYDMVPGFCTHWSMASDALIQLGHPELVHEWASQYAKARRHFPRPPFEEPIDASNESSWRKALGVKTRASDWFQMFERELAESHWREVLVRWWPRLIPGMGAGLTHGLIRTAHALRSISYAGEDHPTRLQLNELAMGLSYWAAYYVEQPGPAVLSGNERLPDILASIPRVDDSGENPNATVWTRAAYEHVREVPGWAAAVARLAPPNDVQAALSDITAAYAQVTIAHAGEFPIPFIHSVTAPAALRLVLPYLPQELHMSSFVEVWRTATAVLTSHGKRLPLETAMPSPEQDLPSVQGLRDRAVEHGGEHELKFTEACLREYNLRPDPRYLLAPHQLLSSARAASHSRKGRTTRELDHT